MRRRDFIKGIAGSTIAWPLAAAAQPRAQKRRVAVLMGGLTSGEAAGQAEVDAIEEGLKEIGWKLGSNIQLDYRWPGAELAQVSVVANEIVAMRLDVLKQVAPQVSRVTVIYYPQQVPRSGGRVTSY